MNISLTGMPASGKTTTAKALRDILPDYVLVDTDEEIINIEKKSINDIFSIYGEKYFRELETKVLTDILKKDKQIISTGGGIVNKNENIKLLKEKSIIIYLKTDIDTLVYRAKSNSERPLLNDCDIKEKMKELILNREENYKKAHYIIDTANKTPENAAKEILEKINENSRS